MTSTLHKFGWLLCLGQNWNWMIFCTRTTWCRSRWIIMTAWDVVKLCVSVNHLLISTDCQSQNHKVWFARVRLCGVLNFAMLHKSYDVCWQTSLIRHVKNIVLITLCTGVWRLYAHQSCLGLRRQSWWTICSVVQCFESFNLREVPHVKAIKRPAQEMLDIIPDFIQGVLTYDTSHNKQRTTHKVYFPTILYIYVHTDMFELS